MPGPGADDDGDGFLGRWSRRKRAAGAGQVDRPAEPLAGTAPAPATPDEAPAEMVEPPSLDLIDKDFDLAHWLKQNVPESWKRAALRRAWESDPVISGYLDPARDYALDWNTPGGAPGYGPLSASDNVEEMLANIFGKEPEKPVESAGSGEPGLREDVAGGRLSSNEAETAPTSALQQEAGEPPALPQAVRRSEVAEPVKLTQNPVEQPLLPEKSAVAAQDQPWPQPAAGRSRRRGGGAIPL